jgi:glycosyltransferase involved in cell wall biosynthesis
MIRCTIGVFAHNEAHNVRRTLHALLAQRLRRVEIAEIIVIASGCTDGTVELAEAVASAYPLVTVDVETTRKGKAAAIKRLTAMARGEIIVLVGADTLPGPTAIQELLAPFVDPTVGMSGARVVPLNAPTRWLGFSVQMLWHVHHHLALRRPKLGELVAFRNVIDDLPEDTATDEPAIEALIISQGYRLAYAPRAVVYNRGPEDFWEFLHQRRRVFAGQVRIAVRYGYLTSSLKLRHVLPLTYEALRSYPRYFVWILGAMAFELWARLLGLSDALRGREEVVWRPATTSKTVVTASEASDLTLISVKWPRGSLDSAAFLRELRRLPHPVEPVFWWDGHHGEVLLKLQVEDAPVEWIQTQIQSVSRDHVTLEHIPESAPVSCRLVRFFSASSPLAN